MRFLSARASASLVCAVLALGSGLAANSASVIRPPKGVITMRRPDLEPTPTSLSGVRPQGAGENWTLLDEVGRLKRPVEPIEVERWKREVTRPGTTAARRAQLHLWLAEYEIAGRENPAGAQYHFRQVQKLDKPTGALYGLAEYDRAITRFLQGAYREAAERFQRLAHQKTALAGYDRRSAALWQRNAKAIYGYHQERAAAGITEPDELDPMCGAAGLGVSLKVLGLPYDKVRVLKACRVTGLGSTTHDLLKACEKLGVSGRLLTADEEGLKRLPKPLIAHVERDHFITVVDANERGVSYRCSECGPWPGGRRNLTWKQWRMLEADVYVSVTWKGSPEDRLLEAVLRPDGKLGRARGTEGAKVRLASSGPLPRIHGGGASPALSTLAQLLRQHVNGYVYLGVPVGCGVRREALHPGPMVGAPMDDPSAGSSGPFGGDPVNLATGEEQYTPGADLTVYNPHGPSISWGRVYNSLRNSSTEHRVQDWGVGWSHSYNTWITDSSVKIIPWVAAGGSRGVNKREKSTKNKR